MIADDPTRAGSFVRPGAIDAAAAEPPFRLAPRFLALNVMGREGEFNGRQRSGDRHEDNGHADGIVLEYDAGSGLVSPAWRSIRPEDARQRWSLQVSRHFDGLLGVLVHRGVPLVWLTTRWDWVGRNVLRPVNPPYLVEILKPVEVSPV